MPWPWMLASIVTNTARRRVVCVISSALSGFLMCALSARGDDVGPSSIPHDHLDAITAKLRTPVACKASLRHRCTTERRSRHHHTHTPHHHRHSQPPERRRCPTSLVVRAVSLRSSDGICHDEAWSHGWDPWRSSVEAGLLLPKPSLLKVGGGESEIEHTHYLRRDRAMLCELARRCCSSGCLPSTEGRVTSCVTSRLRLA